MEVLDVADTPHAADQELRVGLDDRGINNHALDTEVGELGFVDVSLFVEGDAGLVDDPMATALLDRRLDQLGLIAMDVVLSQDRADGVNTRLNGGFIVSRRRTARAGTPERRTARLRCP